MKYLSKTCRLILATACFIGLTACTQVQLGTMWAMRNVDMLKVHPAVMRIALGLPDGASFDSVSVEMKFTRQGEVLIEDRFELDIVTSGSELDQIGLPVEKNNLMVLRVPQIYIAKAVGFQNLILSAQSKGWSTEASFGIDSKLNQEWMAASCGNGMKDIQISAWILVDAEKGYLPLLKDSNLGKLLKVQTSGICAQLD